MPVDLNKINAKLAKVQEKYLGTFKVVDSVELKKSWAKKPSYWVEILRDEDELDGRLVVRKRWSFPREGEQVEGDRMSHPDRSAIRTRIQFLTLVQSKLDNNDYEVVSRTKTVRSPAKDDEFNGRDFYPIGPGPDDDDLLESPQRSRQTVQPVLRRKAVFDV